MEQNCMLRKVLRGCEGRVGLVCEQYLGIKNHVVFKITPQ
jgi:hypothetical protein